MTRNARQGPGGQQNSICKRGVKRDRMHTSADSELITVQEAADRLAVSRWMVYRLIWDQQVESVQIGRCRRIVRQSFDDYLAGLIKGAAWMATRGNPKRNANGQGGVYQRADSRWEAKVFVDTPDGRRKRISVYGDNQRDALDELGKILDQQRRGMLVATTTSTVAEYMTYWLQHVAEPSIRRTTYATYEGDVRLHIAGHRKAKPKGTAGNPYSSMTEPAADDVSVLRPGQGLREKDAQMLCDG
jgi:excisionase family DNA binding protein